MPGTKIKSIDAVLPLAGTLARLTTFGLPSPDVAAAIDGDAHHVRFEEWIQLPPVQHGKDFVLRVTVEDGTTLDTTSVHENARLGDRYYACWSHFVEALQGVPSGDVLELGARARSGVTRRGFVPPHLGYVGLDILAGPNVDVVGDAHALSTLFPNRKFAAIFACSVFEHLAMPWKVVVELNRVLSVGGLVHVQTHQTWPIHDEPWDFWRFSAFSWQCLFNPGTGFELLETAHGEPARVHPVWDYPGLRDMQESPAYLATAVIARKTGETTLDWTVPTLTAAPTHYPTGEIPDPSA